MAEESEPNRTRIESYVIPELSSNKVETRTEENMRESEGEYSVDNEEQLDLIYGAKHVILIFVPVTLCMALVVLTISSVKYYSTDDGNYLIYTPFHPDRDDTRKDTIVKSTLNALIVLGVVVVMTFLLIVLYKMNCYKCMHGWIMLSSLMLLFIFAFIYMQELLKSFNVAVDMITVVIFLYNFGVTGMLMIHWHGPLRLQQAYLIISSALMSLIFIKYMPEWTLWTVLGVLAIWDLVAVLAPHGPLKMLVETAEERGEAVMPALVYSSMVIYTILGTQKDKGRKNETTDNSQSQSGLDSEQSQSSGHPNQAAAKVENPIDHTDDTQMIHMMTAPTGEEVASESTQEIGPGSSRRRPTFRGQSQNQERGVKLGLGDFIFYSVLVGKASSVGNPTITIACFISILMGLFLTLAILVTVRKALPALPISIMLGLIFNFGTEYAISPMMTEFAASQVFL